jgi:glycine/D-amino acid oxidase-like deaminating enzyme
VTVVLHHIGRAPVIVGGGIAGLMTALRLAPIPTVVLTKAPLQTEASSAWATVLHGPGPGCGQTGSDTHWTPIHLPGTALPCRSNTMLTIAITSPGPGIGSRTGRSMTRH